MEKIKVLAFISKLICQDVFIPLQLDGGFWVLIENLSWLDLVLCFSAMQKHMPEEKAGESPSVIKRIVKNQVCECSV